MMSYVREYDLKQTTKYNLYNIISGCMQTKNLYVLLSPLLQKTANFLHTHTHKSNKSNKLSILSRACHIKTHALKNVSRKKCNLWCFL